MKERFSLQWKLTLMTALLIIVACLSLSYFISKSTILYMDEIEDSVITIFPKELFSEDSSGDIELYLDTTAKLSDKFKNTQGEFLGKSLLITSIITLISSALIYFIVGYALRPLQQLGRQIEDIQAKNMQQPIDLKCGSIEIVRLTDAFNGSTMPSPHRGSFPLTPHTNFAPRLRLCRPKLKCLKKTRTL